MKTILEVGKEHGNCEIDVICSACIFEENCISEEKLLSFKSGVEFAQRWISVEDELSPINEFVFVKYKDYDHIWYGIINYSGNTDELFYVSDFRPIEYK